MAPSGAATPDLAVGLTYNHDCFAPAGVVYGDGDRDGSEDTIASSSAPAAGPTRVAGITFTFPSTATAANTLVAAGQKLALPGKSGYRFLQLLGFTTTGATSSAWCSCVNRRRNVRGATVGQTRARSVAAGA